MLFSIWSIIKMLCNMIHLLCVLHIPQQQLEILQKGINKIFGYCNKFSRNRRFETPNGTFHVSNKLSECCLQIWAAVLNYLLSHFLLITMVVSLSKRYTGQVRIIIQFAYTVLVSCSNDLYLSDFYAENSSES